MKFPMIVGDECRIQRYPSVRMIVLKVGKSPVGQKIIYTVRFKDTPEDTRGYLVWADEILP